MEWQSGLGLVSLWRRMGMMRVYKDSDDDAFMLRRCLLFKGSVVMKKATFGDDGVRTDARTDRRTAGRTHPRTHPRMRTRAHAYAYAPIHAYR